MQKTGTLYILIISLFFSGTAYSQTDWKKDIEYLRKEVPANHINFFTIRSKEEWDEGLNKIEAGYAGLSDLTVALQLDQLITSFGDAHTGIGWNPLIDKNKTIPAKFYWFRDGIYITQTTKSNEAILGKRLTRINDLPIEKIAQRLNTLTSLDNTALQQGRVPKLIPIMQVLQYLDVLKGDDIVFGCGR